MSSQDTGDQGEELPDLRELRATLAEHLAPVVDTLGEVGGQLGDVALVVNALRATLTQADAENERRTASATTDLRLIAAAVADLTDKVVPDLQVAFTDLVLTLRDAIPSAGVTVVPVATPSESLALLATELETIARRSDTLAEEQHALRAAVEERIVQLESTLRGAADDHRGALTRIEGHVRALAPQPTSASPAPTAQPEALTAEFVRVALASHLHRVEAQSTRDDGAAAARTAAAEAAAEVVRTELAREIEAIRAEQRSFLRALDARAASLDAAVRERVANDRRTLEHDLEQHQRELLEAVEARTSAIARVSRAPGEPPADLGEQLDAVRAETRELAQAVHERTARLELSIREIAAASAATARADQVQALHADQRALLGALGARATELERAVHETPSNTLEAWLDEEFATIGRQIEALNRSVERAVAALEGPSNMVGGPVGSS